MPVKVKVAVSPLRDETVRVFARGSGIAALHPR
ncbi:hypothetical protein HMPREF9948_2403, partial [Propionibacterium sp. 434-HC2]